MVFKEQGLVLAALLGLLAFFYNAETSITTLWPWRVVNIGATALVTEAATAIFGEAGVITATGVMTFYNKTDYVKHCGIADSMSVWNLLREFCIRKMHMAVGLNEYEGTVGTVTLEDVVEEIVGDIFDENDSKEEIQKKTGYIVMRAEGINDVDAHTSIDSFLKTLILKCPRAINMKRRGFVCEAFGYIPRTGETIKVNLNGKTKKKRQIFKLEILEGNARKVSSVRFKHINHDDAASEDYSRCKNVVRGIADSGWLVMGCCKRSEELSLLLIPFSLLLLEVQLKSKDIVVEGENGCVVSVAIEGEKKDQVVALGEGVDAAALTSLLRKKVGHASLELVHDV
ncbi:DUF21 domain-containing At3g13070, chloroplastic isoform X2 [Olea europaea subsp. europaea]|uniref:DUF21 domain-containing At3g13070, chloroplastic isoform X2 n=1 Tax=Olea europaea subsp. europaea TaxID=158383 RepID=A0A8S0RAL1_OLEEU|nr:DUF21 domain-containing At3g13070, chloroplastic isoform X2 [Olea europaea subsp. europaea]